MITKLCPTCSTPIPAAAPGGFCPGCLLRDAAEPASTGHPAPSLEEVTVAFPTLEVISLIGQGGMGSVYKVRQPSLDRIVALKILAPALSRDPAFAERFAREARVLGKLNHPNIVSVYEHGESGGFYYLIMEYVDGVNLRQAMQAGRFTPEQALAIVPGICDALQAAHVQGIWHRDIKPENILLDQTGNVKIVDFGIARLVSDQTKNFTLTATGNALGSIAYMAPEQHENPHNVDHRADIYSLGVVIYEMLTGELPLGRFPAPSKRAAVSARIDEIVFQTLEKERELRQQSATEVKTDVQSVREINRDPSPMPPSENGWTARSTAKAAVFGGLVLFLSATIFTRGSTESLLLTLSSVPIVLGIIGWIFLPKPALTVEGVLREMNRLANDYLSESFGELLATGSPLAAPDSFQFGRQHLEGTLLQFYRGQIRSSDFMHRPQVALVADLLRRNGEKESVECLFRLETEGWRLVDCMVGELTGDVVSMRAQSNYESKEKQTPSAGQPARLTLAAATMVLTGLVMFASASAFTFDSTQGVLQVISVVASVMGYIAAFLALSQMKSGQISKVGRGGLRTVVWLPIGAFGILLAWRIATVSPLDPSRPATIGKAAEAKRANEPAIGSKNEAASGVSFLDWAEGEWIMDRESKANLYEAAELNSLGSEPQIHLSFSLGLFEQWFTNGQEPRNKMNIRGCALPSALPGSSHNRFVADLKMQDEIYKSIFSKIEGGQLRWEWQVGGKSHVATWIRATPAAEPNKVRFTFSHPDGLTQNSFILSAQNSNGWIPDTGRELELKNGKTTWFKVKIDDATADRINATIATSTDGQVWNEKHTAVNPNALPRPMQLLSGTTVVVDVLQNGKPRIGFSPPDASVKPEKMDPLTKVSHFQDWAQGEWIMDREETMKARAALGIASDEPQGKLLNVRFTSTEFEMWNTKDGTNAPYGLRRCALPASGQGDPVDSLVVNLKPGDSKTKLGFAKDDRGLLRGNFFEGQEQYFVIFKRVAAVQMIPTASLKDAPDKTPERVFQLMNRLANQADRTQFNSHLLKEFMYQGPEGHMDAFVGRIKLNKFIPIELPNENGQFSSAMIFAVFQAVDGRMRYTDFTFIQEDGEWRYQRDNPATFQAECHIEFHPHQGDASEIIKTLLGQDVVCYNIAGFDGQFMLTVEAEKAENAANSANALAEQLFEALKKRGLESTLKILNKATIPKYPKHVGEADINQLEQ